jgi:hypothetical protein
MKGQFQDASAGVYEVGLFCNMAHIAYFGEEDGTVNVRRQHCMFIEKEENMHAIGYTFANKTASFQ